ncbi:uncharacterized protein F5891DRAFT_1042434, partial [Suillus fuscotomentosus]
MFLSASYISLKSVMDNMQILHECRDSRDDYFAERLRSLRTKSNVDRSHTSGTRYSEEDCYIQDTDVLEHLQAIDSCHSVHRARSNDTLMNCLYHAERSGMWQMGFCHACVMADDRSLEDAWEAEYNNRRDAWKNKISVSNDQTSPVNDLNNQVRTDTNVMHSAIRDGNAFRNAEEQQDLNGDCSNGVRNRRSETDIEDDSSSIDGMIHEFSLNLEQARAFRIVAEHSINRSPEQLRMYIGGCGGTGKSQVINVLKEFFRRRNEERRFRLTSYTGVAARNI